MKCGRGQTTRGRDPMKGLGSYQLPGRSIPEARRKGEPAEKQGSSTEAVMGIGSRSEEQEDENNNHGERNERNQEAAFENGVEHKAPGGRS